jgi:hypothetical protein
LNKRIEGTRAKKPGNDANSNSDAVGVNIEWKPSGRSGGGTVIIALADGPFTDSVKIVSESARARLLKRLEGRATQVALDDIRDQLDRIAKDTAAQMSNGDDAANDKDANKLVELVLGDESIELFHAPGDVDCGYATVDIDGKQETFLIGGVSFKAWLSRRFFEVYRSAAGGQAMMDACQVLTGHAVHDGPQIKVETRVAFCSDGIAIDLGDAERNVVLVTKGGWQVHPSSEVPVRFIRRSGCLPLPVPVRGGTVDMLRQYVNLPDDDSWVLVVGFIVASLYPRGPFPVLVISGEQGSAKSTLARMLQRLVDPNKAELRRPPKNEEDLIIAASNTWLLAYDNLSGIRPELSDAICTLATGGGFAARRLFTNGEEVIFQAQRPVMLNGIDDLTRRPDLLDRSIVVRLESIHQSRRQAEDVLWAGFEQVAPKVMGALLDTLAGVLQHRDAVQLDESPRMADLAKTMCAAEAALGWAPRTFLAAYERNRDLAWELAIEESAIAREIVRLMTNVPLWEGTATELRNALFRNAAQAAHGDSRSLPSPERIGKELRRVAPALRHLGVEIEVGARQPHPDRGRIIRVVRTGRWNGSRNSTGDEIDSGRPPLAPAEVRIPMPGNGWDDWNGNSRFPGPRRVSVRDGEESPHAYSSERPWGHGVVGVEDNVNDQLNRDPDQPRQSSNAGIPAENRSNRSYRSSGASAEGPTASVRTCYACGGFQRWRLRDAGDSRPGDWVCTTCHPPSPTEHMIERSDSAEDHP